MSKTRTFMTSEQVKALSFEQAREALDEKRKNMAQIFEGKALHEIPAEDAADVKHLNAELTLIAERYDELAVLHDAKAASHNLSQWLRQPVSLLPVQAGPVEAPEFKDAGLQFIQSAAFKAAQAGDFRGSFQAHISSMYPEFSGLDFDADLSNAKGAKGALGSGGSGLDGEFDVENRRLPGIIGPVGERPLRVETLFPAAGMSGDLIPYMVETTTTKNAIEVSEGAAKSESMLSFTESSSPAQVVATYLPITRQLITDHPAMRGYVNGRLRYFVDARVDSQLLVGDGIAPNLKGILNIAGIQTQAKGADPVPDAIYKGMTKVRASSAGYYVEPDAAVFHPNDWQGVRLMRTTDGIYIWGSPADAGPDRIWGLRVLQTDALTENTGLVGAFRFGAMIFNRWEFGIRMAEQHSDDFTKNKVTLLAERRLAFPVFRPAAFCTVTGI